jgi:hypothetical protein
VALEVGQTAQHLEITEQPVLLIPAAVVVAEAIALPKLEAMAAQA